MESTFERRRLAS
ncbi:UNVERIFIED_CONTAM: hypothetical protein GTU68_052625 [Idotea baltica]|nr:hypothetical protein [Idotea baltica]